MEQLLKGTAATLNKHTSLFLTFDRSGKDRESEEFTGKLERQGNQEWNSSVSSRNAWTTSPMPMTSTFEAEQTLHLQDTT